MKILSLKIESKNGFRSLPEGFEIKFRSNYNREDLSSFSPYCLVGLNGCGKSNVMEALAHIFYHVELCISEHLPDYIQNTGIFDPKNCVIQAFTLEYIIRNDLDHDSNHSELSLIKLSKKEKEAPKITITDLHLNSSETFSFSLDDCFKEDIISLKQFLPQYIVAYSSGENETLSIPFFKSRLLHLEEFKQATIGNYKDYINPENNLIYIDANMSQAILLCCLLFEDENTLKTLADYRNTKLLGIQMFRMRLKGRKFKDVEGNSHSYFELLKRDLFPILQSCATMSWYDDENDVFYFDFFVNEATKFAFRHYFNNSSMECFQMFRLLYELNNYSVSQDKIRDVLASKGIYTDEKIGSPSPEDDVFHFLDFFVKKQIDKEGNYEKMLLRQFSDGEHQFIHTMGICLLLKEKESLLLLDEPETHFNPSWRSMFISILHKTIQAACSDNSRYIDEINLRKEILITSHSPFIISDCKAENVIIFEKNEEDKTVAQSAADMRIATYGTSISLLMDRIFHSTASIGEHAEKGMKAIVNSGGTKEDIIENLNAEFGDSVEKLLTIDALK